MNRNSIIAGQTEFRDITLLPQGQEALLFKWYSQRLFETISRKYTKEKFCVSDTLNSPGIVPYKINPF